MRKQTIVWTAIPHRTNGSAAEGATLKLSVLASPRLWNDDPAVTKMALAEFPDWLDWPALVGQASFQLEFDGGQTVAATADMSTLSSARWQALFKPTTDVVPFVFEDASGAELISFSAFNLHDDIRKIYQRAGIDPAFRPDGNLPPRSVLEADQDLIDIARPVRPEPPYEPEDGERGASPSTGLPEDPMGCLLWLLLLPLRLLRRLLKALGLIGVVPLLAVLAWWPGRMWLANGGGTGGVGGSSPPVGGDRPAYRELREFLQPASPQRSDLPGSEAELAEVYDFHKMIAALGDYPLLLRQLGLVVDLTISVPAGGLPASGTVRLIPTLPPTAPTTNYTPRTHYQLADAWFLPRPRVAHGDLSNGLLRLNDTSRFQVQQVDVVGAAIKLQNAATNLVGLRQIKEVPVNNPPGEGLPALQSAGIAVARKDEPIRLREILRRQYALNRGVADEDRSPVRPIGSGGPDPKPDKELYAEDLVRGYRVDIRDKAAKGWLSLCQRDGTYAFLQDSSATFSGRDEGFVQTSATEPINPGATRVLRVHETVFAWDGWSLTAPRPGVPIATAGDKHEPIENKAATPFGLEVAYSAVEGSLPRLRYGHSYRIRGRVVDLCGNSAFGPEDQTVFDADQPEVSAQFIFRRFEPVGPPPVVLRSEPKEGESLERLTVRSALGDDQADIEKQETERHLAPPKGAQLLAERCGHFDGPQGRMDADAAGYARAAREAGSVTEELDLTSGKLEVVPGVNVADPDKQDKTYHFLQQNDSFEATYLPDPFARGVLLLGLPRVVANSTVTDGVERVAFDGSWPGLRSVRLRVRGAPAGAAPGWSAAAGVVTITVPQGETYTVRLASYFDDADLEQMGVWGWIQEAAAPSELPALRQEALEGRSWLHLPFRELTLVHAVQQPLQAPAYNAPSDKPSRVLGETSVQLEGALAVDAKSTGKVDLYAAWSDPIDDPETANDPESYRAEQSMHVRELVLPDATDDNPSIAKILADMGDSSSTLLHQIGDTKYHLVSYRAVGTTRFREYFPPSIADDPSKLTTPSALAAAPLDLHIRNTRRPDALRPHSVLPTFRWEETNGTGILTRVRHGGGLRVYVHRPWWSSGDHELLGVTLLPAGFTGDDAKRDRMRKYTSEWGMDPIWDSLDFAALRLDDFANKADTGVDLPLAEVPGVIVDAAGFRVAYDSARHLWYADIQTNIEGHYFPFIRLAMARFQKRSVAGAELSPVVLSDFLQLAPDRTATYDLNSVGPNGSIPVSVSGWAPRARYEPAYGDTFVIARLEERQQAGDASADPLGWRPRETVLLERATDDALQSVWQGEVPLPASLTSPLRVAVYEAQLLRADGRPIADVLGMLEAGAVEREEAVGVAEVVFRERTAEFARTGYRVVYADATIVA